MCYYNINNLACKVTKVLFTTYVLLLEMPVTLHVVPVHWCLPGYLICAVSVSTQLAISFEEQSTVWYIKSMFMHNQWQIQHHKCVCTHSHKILKLHFSYQSFILHFIAQHNGIVCYRIFSSIWPKNIVQFGRTNLLYIFIGGWLTICNKLLFLINVQLISNTYFESAS